jgi:hypothetical protein
VAGSGLGAPIWWGRPSRGVRPEVHYFAHNGYVWLWWKIGLVGAVLLVGGIFAAALRPGRARGSPFFAVMVTGAQGALLALMIAAVTFPSMTARPITATMGVLVALCLVPFERRRRVRDA